MKLNVSASLSFSCKISTSGLLWQHFSALFWLVNLHLECWKMLSRAVFERKPLYSGINTFLSTENALIDAS